MKRLINIAGTLFLALIGAVGGAMLTTNYATMRTNGASYLPALQGGLGSLWHGFIAIVSSLWFLVPLGAIILIFVTVRLTLRATRPKKDPFIAIGHRMNAFVNAAHHDQKFRDLTSVYHDTMRICREMEAFVVEIQMNGIPVPSHQSNSAEDWIDLCCEYFTAVGPYLRNGNSTYALGVAQGFADRYPRRG
ncbi:MAG: hypothetical protein WC803_11685 [Sphingomonas sp.]|jgi:hypothetical protein